MSNHPKPKLCMFCGKDESFGPMSKEHFAFKSLWAGPRPEGTRTVLAHEHCNTKFSEDNDYVRDILAMEAGAEQHPEVKRLQEGKLKRKLQNRPGAFAKTLKNLRLVPHFTPSGLYVGNAPVFDVDWPRINRVLHNVIKGIYYTAVDEPLPQDCVFGVIPVTDDKTLEYCRPLIDCMVDWQSFRDDVFRCRYVTSTSDQRINCLMQFYRKRLFFGEALPPRTIAAITSRQKQRSNDAPA